MKEYIIEEEINLFDFLKSKNYSKNNIKNLIKRNLICINDSCDIRYDYKLSKGEKLIIKKSKDIDVIFEDNNIIVVNKPYNLLTVSNDKQKDKTLFKNVSNYVKLKNKNNKVFIINRIDKDTSGIVMFAKNKSIKEIYQKRWNDIVINRCYYAIVVGKMKLKENVIKNYLFEDKNYIVHSTKNRNKGKLAITEYKVLKENNKYSLLDINIRTGRKNQIRVHMKENNTPILGDQKYGFIKEKRMYLHSYKLELINPITNEKCIFETKIPKEFNKII